MRSATQSAGYFRLVGVRTDPPALDPAAFAWEILRRRADYLAEPAPLRRVISAHGRQPVILIECVRTTDHSWGLLFR